MIFFSGRVSEFSEIEYKAAYSLLSELRKSQVDRMRFELDKKRSVLGELLARKAINKLCGAAEKDIVIAKTENGKPYCQNSDLFFSISHCKDMAVCVADRKEIGVDIEFVRDIDYRITRFACVDKDMDFINSATDEQEKRYRFFCIWTAKEAYLKCLGTGIRGMRDIAYDDIRQFCTTTLQDGYMITVYSK